MFNSHIGRANYPKVLVVTFLGFSDSARPARHTVRSDSGDADLACGEHRIGPDKAEEQATRNESGWGRRSRVAGKTRAIVLRRKSRPNDAQSWLPHLPMGAFAHVEFCFVRLRKKTFPDPDNSSTCHTRRRLFHPRSPGFGWREDEREWLDLHLSPYCITCTVNI